MKARTDLTAAEAREHAAELEVKGARDAFLEGGARPSAIKDPAVLNTPATARSLAANLPEPWKSKALKLADATDKLTAARDALRAAADAKKKVATLADALGVAAPTAIATVVNATSVVVSAVFASNDTVAAASYVSPVAGIIAAFPIISNHKTGFDTPWVTPYLGASIYLDAVDRVIPLHDLVGSRFRQRFSITIGVVARAVSVAPGRARFGLRSGRRAGIRSTRRCRARRCRQPTVHPGRMSGGPHRGKRGSVLVAVVRSARSVPVRCEPSFATMSRVSAPTAPAPPAQPGGAPSRRLYPALDGLRGVAVLVVMLHNLTILEQRDSLAARFWVFATDAGWIGVLLFFVLSGFLITGILLDDRLAPRFFRDFYLRRVLRIFPLYYLVLIARFAVLPWLVRDAWVPLEVALGYWLYVSNWTELFTHGINGFGHFWSLAVEEQFYLAWPLAVARLGARRLIWVCATLIALSVVARVVIVAAGIDRRWLYLSTVTRADALAFGALVAIALRDPRGRAWLVRRYRAIGGADAAVMLAIMIYAHGLSRYQIFVETVGYATLAIGFAAGIAHVALDDAGARPRWAMSRVLRAAGKYSYAAYVFHPLVKVAVLHAARPALVAHGALTTWYVDAAFVAACGTAAFALARLSYAVLEGPLLRCKDRWAPRAPCVGGGRTSGPPSRPPS